MGSGLRAPGSGLRAPGSWLSDVPGRRDLRVEFSGDVCIVGHASGFVVGLIGPSGSNLSADVASRLRPGRSPWGALHLCSALPVVAVDRSAHHLPALPSPWEALRLCSALPVVAAADKPSLNLSAADIGVVSDGCTLPRVGAVVESVGVSAIPAVGWLASMASSAARVALSSAAAPLAAIVAHAATLAARSAPASSCSLASAYPTMA